MHDKVAGAHAITPEEKDPAHCAVCWQYRNFWLHQLGAPHGVEIKRGQLWRSPAGDVCTVVSVDLWGVLLRWPDGTEGRPKIELFADDQRSGYKLVSSAAEVS